MYFREVVASLYPWDLLDEGVERILDVLQEETRCNATYLVALMHDEKRPLTDFYYPHNPRRKVYWTEDSRAYWRPNPESYRGSRIKPRLSDNPDLAQHYDIDMIQTCVRGFNPGRALAAATEPGRLVGLALGGCFCAHCEQAARRAGLDWAAIVRRLRGLADGLERRTHQAAFEMELLQHSSTTATALLAEMPELYQFLKFRVDSLTGFFKDIYEAVHAVRPDIDVRLNHYARYPELMGLDLRATAPYFDSVRSSDYSEQTGDPARMEWKRAYLHSIRRAVGLDKYVLSAVSPRPRATPELVRMGVLISAQCGADALTIGHYDGAWMSCLRAIRVGLEEAGIEIRKG
jgi:hypothetical protein